MGVLVFILIIGVLVFLSFPNNSEKDKISYKENGPVTSVVPNPEELFKNVYTQKTTDSSHKGTLFFNITHDQYLNYILAVEDMGWKYSSEHTSNITNDNPHYNAETHIVSVYVNSKRHQLCILFNKIANILDIVPLNFIIVFPKQDGYKPLRIDPKPDITNRINTSEQLNTEKAAILNIICEEISHRIKETKKILKKEKITYNTSALCMYVTYFSSFFIQINLSKKYPEQTTQRIMNAVINVYRNDAKMHWNTDNEHEIQKRVLTNVKYIIENDADTQNDFEFIRCAMQDFIWAVNLHKEKQVIFDVVKSLTVATINFTILMLPIKSLENITLSEDE